MTSPVQKLLIAILQKPHVFSKIELYILVQKPLIYVLHHIRYPINRFEEGGIVPLTYTDDSLPLIGRYIRPEDPQLQKSSLAQTTQFTTRMTTAASPDHYFITASATARTQPTALD